MEIAISMKIGFSTKIHTVSIGIVRILKKIPVVAQL